MEITVKQLLEGKATKIKEKSFYTTKDYVEPFFDRMSKFTSEFKVQVKTPEQITRTISDSSSSDDVTYNRVWIQAIMPEELSFHNHKEVVGMVYGLDVRKPIVKIYRGALNMACLNLCVFNPSFLDVKELKEGTPIDFRPITRLMEQTSDIKAWLDQLQNTTWERSPKLIESNLGKWVRNSINEKYVEGYGTIKLSPNTVIDAYKSLFEDTKSKYYIKEDEDVNMFKVYNAFTELITNDNAKDIVNKVEKTLLLRQILGF